LGANVKTLSRLLKLHAGNLLPSGASILDLGVQEIYARGEEDYIRSFIQYFSDRDSRLKPAGGYSEAEVARLADRGYAGELLVASGFKYHSLDIFEGYNTILFDLNIHEPLQEMFEKFDLVTNLGTTEHIINQYQSMRTIHQLTKQGGLIYHDLPMSGYHMHGYFSYNPLLFQHLAMANGYEIVMQVYLKGETEPTPRFMSENGLPDNDFSNFGIEFIFRKTSSQPFRMPLDIRTSLGFDDSVWTARNPKAGEPAAASAPAAAANYLLMGAKTLDRCSGWELQHELLSRYRHHISRWFGRGKAGW
jgi:hypothetical protein